MREGRGRGSGREEGGKREIERERERREVEERESGHPPLLNEGKQQHKLRKVPVRKRTPGDFHGATYMGGHIGTWTQYRFRRSQAQHIDPIQDVRIK
jgi:hypothetical protein